MANCKGEGRGQVKVGLILGGEMWSYIIRYMWPAYLQFCEVWLVGGGRWEVEVKFKWLNFGIRLQFVWVHLDHFTSQI